MNRTAKDLLNETMIPVQLLSKKIERHGDGWDSFGPYKLDTDEVLIVRITKYNKNLLHLVTFDEKTKVEKAYVVPPNFMMKMNPTEKSAQLIQAYEQYILKELPRHLGYIGSAIGSDPEIFVEDEKGEIIPAFNFLGSKKNPSKAPAFAYGSNNCYWDGFQAEFDTTAQSCMGWHSDSIQCGLLGTYQHMKTHNKNAKLSAKTVFNIPYELLKTSKPEHVEFGCMPSFNAYGMKGVAAPGAEVLYRSAGGHIHFGLSSMSLEDLERIVKALDAIIGVACVSLFAKFDNPKRREMYGLAGEYRVPPHGLEYRVLSNAWLFHPLAANMIFDLARSVVSFGYKNYMRYWKCSEAETIRIINECDVFAARKVLKENQKLFTKIASTKYGEDLAAEFVFNTMYYGIENVVDNFEDIEHNWRLNLPRNNGANPEGWTTHCNNPGNNVASSYKNVYPKLVEAIKKDKEAEEIELAMAAIPIFPENKK